MKRLYGPRHMTQLLDTIYEHQRQQATLLKSHTAQRKALGEMLERPGVNPLDVMRAEVELNRRAPTMEFLCREP